MITDLEVFEIITNLYPDKFPRGDDSDWDGVLEFALETFDGNLPDLLSRLVKHSPVFESPLTKQKFRAVMLQTDEWGPIALLRRPYTEGQSND